MPTRVDINRELLSWSILRAGHDLDEFLVENPIVHDWIEGRGKPTIKQLEAFSNRVHIPFGYLFLKNPPKEVLPIPYFRTIENAVKQVSLNVYDTILLLEYRQEWLKEYLTEIGYDKLDFVGEFANTVDHKLIVNSIRNYLDFAEDWANQLKSWEDALQFLTQRIENIGVVVVFNGVVENNTHRVIDVNDCRGFVLVDEIAPFMFINNSDSKAAQMFTLIHELAHIWMGKSAGFDLNNMQPANNPVEILCDKVAAEFLVPENSFLRIWAQEQDFLKLARLYKVSPIVISRRALDLHKITLGQFLDFYDNYIAEFHYKKSQQSSGGDFYNTAKKRISVSFASHVNTAVRQDRLLYRDAYKLTGLKPNTFQKFVSEHLY